jgi:hypothetical protein
VLRRREYRLVASAVAALSTHFKQCCAIPRIGERLVYGIGRDVEPM